MRPARVLAVVGARPNFMKVAPILRAMSDRTHFETALVHTGQHYDDALSDAFFRDLEIPPPDVYLGVGSGSHAAQTARILETFAPVVESRSPDLVLVAGDVNSTVACSLAAVKLGVPVGHVEAGLRSHDRTMPEEINRVLTDAISDLLFITSLDARQNLEREGIDPGTIHFVGNSMIDTLRRLQERAGQSTILGDQGLSARGYALVTLHRPSNVDSASDLDRVIGLLEDLADRIPVVFPMHPRTRARLEALGKWSRVESTRNLLLLPPLGYLDFLALMMHARIVLTDSGGVQEETTALGVHCLTLRPNTERPITVEEGTNLRVSDDPATLLAAFDGLGQDQRPRPPRIPDKWDGRAGERIASVIRLWFEQGATSRVRPDPSPPLAPRPGSPGPRS